MFQLKISIFESQTTYFSIVNIYQFLLKIIFLSILFKYTKYKQMPLRKQFN